MKSFEYATPSTLEEATGLLSDSWGEAEVLAGGTDLVTSLKQRITTPKRVVSLKKISDLSGIEKDGDTLVIGATTPLIDCLDNSDVKSNFPALVTAIQEVSAAQILSVGTVGGDLCQRPRCWYYRNGMGLLAMNDGKSLVENGENRYHAIFGNEGAAKFVSASSLGPALIALGATMEAAGPNGSRKIAAKDFFHTPGSDDERETTLKPNEILTRIHVPMQGLTNSTYEVRHREGLDWPLVTATVAFAENGGKASDGRVVLGHVAPTPWHHEGASKALNGSGTDEEAAAKVGEAAMEGANPLSDNRYKVHLVKVAVKRAITAAAG